MSEPYERVVPSPRWTPTTFELVVRAIHVGECEVGCPGTIHRRTAVTVLAALANAGVLREPDGTWLPTATRW